MGFKDWVQKKTEEGRQEIEKSVADKLMEEELNPTLRKHSGEPQGKTKEGK